MLKNNTVTIFPLVLFQGEEQIALKTPIFTSSFNFVLPKVNIGFISHKAGKKTENVWPTISFCLGSSSYIFS